MTKRSHAGLPKGHGYSGIGIEAVRAFRSAGAKVVVPAREMAKAKANVADMPDV